MRNYLTIAGKDSRDFGVYISGQGTFSAPEKAYEFYSVPGRNGAILGNDNRLENIEVSYNCFIYTDFKRNIEEFRTFLLSLDGYQRLTDTYNPDEYRMAVYVGPFEPEVTEKNNAGAFVLTFNCKPQRFLISGETRYSWLNGGDLTLRGDSITAYVDRLKPKFDVDVSGVTYLKKVEIQLDGETLYRFPQTGTFPNPWDNINNVGIGTFIADIDSGSWYTTRRMRKFSPTFTFTKLSGQDYDVFKSVDTFSDIQAFYGADARIDQFRAQWEKVPYKAWFTPYFPTDPEATEQETCEKLASLSVYPYQHQGHYSVFNGYLYVYDPDRTDFTAQEFHDFWKDYCVVYYGYTGIAPRTYFDPFDFSTLRGQDYATFECIVDSGDGVAGSDPMITMEYSAGDDMSNPTLFPSSPLIRVYGNGAFRMDGVNITVSGASVYTDIDCELMDCYEGSTNKNKYVIFSSYDFPKLRPGANEIKILSGITKIELWPRWWRV